MKVHHHSKKRTGGGKRKREIPLDMVKGPRVGRKITIVKGFFSSHL